MPPSSTPPSPGTAASAGLPENSGNSTSQPLEEKHARQQEPPHGRTLARAYEARDKCTRRQARSAPARSAATMAMACEVESVPMTNLRAASPR